MRPILALYQQEGPEKFTALVTEFAPYFDSIDPLFTQLEAGYAEVSLKNQKKVHNHLGTVHAIAMCNAAELAAGTMTDASIPENAQWIPKGMTVAYVKKAKTDLNVICDARSVDLSLPGDIVVPVKALDTDKNIVFTADITMNIKHT